MKRKILSMTMALATLGFVQSAQAQYTVEILHPAGYAQSASYGGGDGQQVGAAILNPLDFTNAAVWSGSAATFVNLHPAGFMGSLANGADGTQQVGWAGGLDGNPNAALWSGTAASFVNLMPVGFSYSIAQGVSAGRQVGFGYIAGLEGESRALLWSGTAASVIDLTPLNAFAATATSIFGTQQAGTVFGFDGSQHAVIWSDTAESVVDIHPPAYLISGAIGTDGTHQVGFAQDSTTSFSHAMLWSGSAASAIDLHPAGNEYSVAFAIRGARQVGYFGSAGGGHAALWTGSAASMIDLHSFLPAQYTFSVANGVDSFGNVSGYAIDGNGNQVAVLWKVPPPPPTTFTFIGFLQPINEPPKPESSFNRRSVIPFRFRLKNSLGQNVAWERARFTLEKIGSTPQVIIPESWDLQFLYNPWMTEYDFLLVALPLQAGQYRATAKVLSTGQTHSVTFRIKN